MPDRANIAGAVRENGLPFSFSPKLSLRETQTLTLAAMGCTNEEIGRWLCLTPRAVRLYLNNAYSKLGARNRPHAVAIAMHNRLIQFDTV
jgi:DNA-binding NarL/FixJ family response regulator